MKRIGIIAILSAVMLIQNGCADKGADGLEKSVTNLTEEQVIEIAKEYAVKEGRDLSRYPKIRATFDKKEGTWDVSFMMDPTPPGGFFDVLIEDKTGNVLHFWLGE